MATKHNLMPKKERELKKTIKRKTKKILYSNAKN